MRLQEPHTVKVGSRYSPCRTVKNAKPKLQPHETPRKVVDLAVLAQTVPLPLTTYSDS